MENIINNRDDIIITKLDGDNKFIRDNIDNLTKEEIAFAMSDEFSYLDVDLDDE